MLTKFWFVNLTESGHLKSKARMGT